MKCTIFYFSGTGNTKWIVKKTTKLLKSKDHDAVNYPIEKLTGNQPELIASAVQNCDYIGFAYPLYGADAPRIMREFCDEFVKYSKVYNNSKAKLLFINTFGFVNGHGFFRIKRKFKHCDLPIIGYFNFRLVNNTSLQGEIPLPLGDKMPEHIKNKSIAKINRLIYSLENDKKIIQGIGPHLIMGGIIRRILADKIKKNYENMSVDYTACIKCMKCVKNCPTQSIKFEKEKFIFRDTCETCWRCYILCPVNAISTKNNL